VIDWVVKIRKREEIRLSKEKEGSKPAGDDDEVDRMDQSNKNIMSTKWLLGLTGTGKTTGDIMTVLDGIEREIRETGSGFPDLEILPNVSSNENGSPSQSHSRTQSRQASHGPIGLGLDLGGSSAVAGTKRKASAREDTPVSRSDTSRSYASPVKRRRADISVPGMEQLQRAVESGWEAVRHSPDVHSMHALPAARSTESH
jgi:hypothetical protein